MDAFEVLRAERLADTRLPLEQATTLPSEAYVSAEIYQREVERLFEREWLCAGRIDQIPAAGDYFTLDLLGDKLVVVRGADGEIRVLSRICRHRAAELVSGAGNARSFQCPYHAWSYRLDGSLVGAPHMAEAFDREACRLPEIRSEIWEGWIFVNFDGAAAPLVPQLAALSEKLAPLRMSEMVSLETATFDSPFNWKVLVDNFMEAYHHIAVHRDTLEPLFPAALSTSPDNDGPWSLLEMPTKPDQAAIHDGLLAAVVYPFHLFAPSHDSLVWYQLLPTEVGRFTLRIFNCFPREALEGGSKREAIDALCEFTKRVHLQDIAACEATFAGLSARSFTSGRLSTLEKPIWQFNQWWIERMAS